MDALNENLDSGLKELEESTKKGMYSRIKVAL